MARIRQTFRPPHTIEIDILVPDAEIESKQIGSEAGICSNGTHFHFSQACGWCKSAPDFAFFGLKDKDWSLLYTLMQLYRCHYCLPVNNLSHRSIDTTIDSLCCIYKQIEAIFPRGFPTLLIPPIASFINDGVNDYFLMNEILASLGLLRCRMKKKDSNYELWLEIENNSHFDECRRLFQRYDLGQPGIRDALIKGIYHHLENISNSRAPCGDFKESSLLASIAKSELLDTTIRLLRDNKNILLLSAAPSLIKHYYTISKPSFQSLGPTVLGQVKANHKRDKCVITRQCAERHLEEMVVQMAYYNNQGLFGIEIGVSSIMAQQRSTHKSHLQKLYASTCSVFSALRKCSLHVEGELEAQFTRARESRAHADQPSAGQEIIWNLVATSKGPPSRALAAPKPGPSQMSLYYNLKPRFNRMLGHFVLPFDDERIDVKSILNCKIVRADDSSKATILQFGRIKHKPHEFILDFQHPMSPFKAFAIALSAIMWCQAHDPLELL